MMQPCLIRLHCHLFGPNHLQLDSWHHSPCNKHRLPPTAMVPIIRCRTCSLIRSISAAAALFSCSSSALRSRTSCRARGDQDHKTFYSLHLRNVDYILFLCSISLRVPEVIRAMNLLIAYICGTHIDCRAVHGIAMRVRHQRDGAAPVHSACIALSLVPRWSGPPAANVDWQEANDLRRIGPIALPY